jgi:hypothetical protein
LRPVGATRNRFAHDKPLPQLMREGCGASRRDPHQRYPFVPDEFFRQVGAKATRGAMRAGTLIGGALLVL